FEPQAAAQRRAGKLERRRGERDCPGEEQDEPNQTKRRAAGGWTRGEVGALAETLEDQEAYQPCSRTGDEHGEGEDGAGGKKGCLPVGRRDEELIHGPILKGQTPFFSRGLPKNGVWCGFDGGVTGCRSAGGAGRGRSG